MTHAQFKVGDEVIVLFYNAYNQLGCSRGILDRFVNESRYHIIENGTGKVFFCDSLNMLSGDASREEVIAKAKAYLEEIFLEPLIEGPLERIFS